MCEPATTMPFESATMTKSAIMAESAVTTSKVVSTMTPIITIAAMATVIRRPRVMRNWADNVWRPRPTRTRLGLSFSRPDYSSASLGCVVAATQIFDDPQVLDIQQLGCRGATQNVGSSNGFSIETT